MSRMDPEYVKLESKPWQPYIEYPFPAISVISSLLLLPAVMFPVRPATALHKGNFFHQILVIFTEYRVSLLPYPSNRYERLSGPLFFG